MGGGGRGIRTGVGVEMTLLLRGVFCSRAADYPDEQGFLRRLCRVFYALTKSSGILAALGLHFSAFPGK